MKTVALALLVASFVGCSAYVNIPPQDRDVARHNPNLSGVIDVELAALRESLRDQPIEGQFRVALPVGSKPETYSSIVPKLGENAVYSTSEAAAGADLPTLDVRQVNIRGTYAWVDIVRPWDPKNPGGPKHLFTVYLQWEITTNWRADHTRIWRVPVDEALEASLKKEDPKPGQWW